MTRFFARHRLTCVGLLLVVATLGTALLGIEHLLAGRAAAMLLIALAAIKCVLIVLDFMDLRMAPVSWRTLPLIWVIVVSGMILASFLIECDVASIPTGQP